MVYEEEESVCYPITIIGITIILTDNINKSSQSADIKQRDISLLNEYARMLTEAAWRQKLEGKIPAIAIIMRWQDFYFCDMMDW